MYALTLTDDGPKLLEREPPVAGPGEALIRVTRAGICNTDLELARGYMGFRGVLGHELCGVVEASDDPRWVGRRVAGEINLGCEACDACAHKLQRHCPNRTVLGIAGKDGCFASHVTLPLTNLHRLPDGLEDDLACFVEPCAAAFEILEQVPFGSRDRVAVLGDGKLGLLAAQVIATTGAQVTVIGKHARKLEIARGFGLQTSELGTLAELAEKSFDRVVEATGSPEGMRSAIRLTRPRGTIVLKSTYHGPLTLQAAPLVIDELSVVGSRCGPFAPAIIALQTGAVSVRPLIDAVVPLSSGPSVLERASSSGTLKVLLDPQA